MTRPHLNGHPPPCPECQSGLFVSVAQGHDLGQRVVGDVEGFELCLDAEKFLSCSTSVALMEGDDTLRASL